MSPYGSGSHSFSNTPKTPQVSVLISLFVAIGPENPH